MKHNQQKVEIRDKNNTYRRSGSFSTRRSSGHLEWITETQKLIQSIRENDLETAEKSRILLYKCKTYLARAEFRDEIDQDHE